MAKKPRRKRTESVFSNNFKKVLTDRQITLKMASELAEVPYSTIADWQNGAVPNQIEAVGRFCKKLGVDFEWLMLGTKSSIDVEQLPPEELFDEQDVGLEGIFRIKAVRLVKRNT